jgi:hypothetical protein
MISQLSRASSVTLTPEDAAICTGAGRTSYSGVSSVATDRMATRAGIIYLMRKGDRRDFAKILAGVDMEFRDVAERHFARAFLVT